MKSLTLFVIVDENASANPARDALIPGVKITTRPLTLITTLESRLNRAESQRFTNENTSVPNYTIHYDKKHCLTSPHPVVRI